MLIRRADQLRAGDRVRVIQYTDHIVIKCGPADTPGHTSLDLERVAHPNETAKHDAFVLPNDDMIEVVIWR